MRHLTLALVAALTIALPGGALVQPAVAQDLAPVVIVNDRAITRYEVAQRQRFMQVLGATDASPAAAEAALTDERLQIEEARRLKIVLTEQEVRAGVTEFASRGGLDADGFLAEMARAGVDAQTVRDFVSAGLVWRQVLRQRVAPAVSVSDREVAQLRKRVIEQPRVTQVLVSELIIPAPPGNEASALARAEQITRTVGSEAGFAEAARRYSAAQTAANGGRLPWTPISQLPEGLAPILLSLRPGQTTQPLTIPGAVVLFYLRDTRGEQRPGATAETVRYVRVTLPSVAEAQSLAATADGCDTLYVAARGRPVQDQTLSSGSLPADVAGRLAALDPDESVILNRGTAADVVMLCSRGPSLLAGDGAEAPIPGLPTGSLRPAAPSIPVADGAAAVALPEEAGGFAPPPTAEEARGRLFDQKVDQGSNALLAELRANAIIRRP